MFDHFYSDPHFGHKNIIGYTGRPFADLREMHEAFVGKYNSRVRPGEDVLWCGDAFFCKEAQATEILGAMNGRKFLVRGNHDKMTRDALVRAGFSWVVGQLPFDMGGRRFLACHYPYAAEAMDARYRDRMPVPAEGVTLVHGHTHSKHRSSPGAIHVGVDAWDYRPASAAEVLALAEASP